MITIPERRLHYPGSKFNRLTHYLFRYPAKFHPPVARKLIESFSKRGELILDPFCGSGTLLVEAATLERRAIGTDIDPVAVFISRVKTHRFNLTYLQNSLRSLLNSLDNLERSPQEYDELKFSDLGESEYLAELRQFEVQPPELPNAFHWFRRYVLVDLARIRNTIATSDAPTTHKELFQLIFARIIRSSSNADPVPVSGLEVTSHMKKMEKRGRIINPFNLFRRAAAQTLEDMGEFIDCCAVDARDIRVRQADATQIHKAIGANIDVIITSPPYHNAVDYYRRHTLEMYWLGFVKDREDRLKLLPRYIGRSRVSKHHALLRECTVRSAIASSWEVKIRKQSAIRANAFKHYLVAMQNSMDSMAKRLPKAKLAVLVLGKNAWNGHEIPTIEIFSEITQEKYEIIERFWYPLKNRYMTYSRHNGADISKEHVIVLRRK